MQILAREQETLKPVMVHNAMLNRSAKEPVTTVHTGNTKGLPVMEKVLKEMGSALETPSVYGSESNAVAELTIQTFM